MNNDIRMMVKEALDNLWAHVKTMFSGLDTRVTALEQGGGGGGGAVSGVKGDAESTYRTGNVNLTAANIGALPDTTPIPSTPGDIGAQTDVGLYIDSAGYLCQRISSDT